MLSVKPVARPAERATSSGQALTRRRNQRGEGARLKEEVIAAAMRLLDRSPHAELSLRTVAREAGVAAPSLYRQFPDAEAMLKEIVRECWAQLGTALVSAPGCAEPPGALGRLQEQMGAYVRYAMQRPSRYQLLFAPPLASEAEYVGPVRPAYRAVLETVERHAAEGGRLPTADPVSATLLAISFAHGRIALAHLAPARPGNVATEVEAFVRETLARLFAR